MKRKKKLLCFMVMFLCLSSVSLNAFAANTTMKNKKWVSGKCGVYEEDEDGYIDFRSFGTSYYKIKIPKQGYIMVDVKTSPLPGEADYNAQNDYESESSTEVNLLNSSKKVLSENSNVLNGKKNFSFSWAVKKGTYYLAVSGDQQYKIRYSFTEVKKVNKAGKSLKNAAAVKRGATVKNLLFSDQDHYYKIKLSKKSKITLSFNSKIKNSDDVMEMMVRVMVKKGNSYRCINEKGKVLSKNASSFWEIEEKGKVSLKLPKGTYYIGVRSAGSGYYTMKWK